MNKFVLDTSVIVDGRIINLINNGKISGNILITRASIAEIEHQANMKKETGFAAFATLEKIRELEKTLDISVEVVGDRPSPRQIENAKETGEIDAIIRRTARELDAVLVTGDKVQHEVAKVEGIDTIYLKSESDEKVELEFEKYFTPDTMSIHIRENAKVKAKVGGPGAFKLVEFDEVVSLGKARRISDEIIEAVKRNKDYYLEMDKDGATVAQLGEYRVVITKRPFSDAFEITVIRPIKKMSLEDYSISKKLMNRLNQNAEGIIICGSPGSGKSTFAAALAEHYEKQNKVVKTMEQPRDLQVGDNITQYAQLEGSFENTKEILLLVRPDYTIYDEMRKVDDFKIYSDMRMAGIGLIGVVHGSTAIDAIQRFIGKVDLGMLPQIVDTVILIDKGSVGKVYAMEQKVKVPSGMREMDLARPVIEVSNLETGVLEYEIYKFGEETVVLKLDPESPPPSLDRLLSKLLSEPYELRKKKNKIILKVGKRDYSRIKGSLKKRFKSLERKYGKFEITAF